MKKKLQVFVSSTYTDMLAERQAAVEAILRAGHIPAGMELFAGDESQLETIRRWIDDSDVFMLMLGGRYGSIEPRSGKSYIELECEYAIRKGKSLFAAVITEEYLTAKVKASGPDAMERDNGHLLKAFRETTTKRVCRFFGDINELKLIVFESLARFEQREDFAGWIHGSDVINPKAVLEEVARLQAENARLRRQMAEWKAAEQALPFRGSPDALASQLSEDAKTLLLAAKASDGHLVYLQVIGGATLHAGNKNFIEHYSHREDARWRAAMDELRGYRLIEGVRKNDLAFRLTKLGYQVADVIEGEKK